MPVAVGIVLSIIFLVAFSQWFYNLAIGWGQIVIDDVYFKYRIAGVTALTFVVITLTFFTMALVSECPKGTREGPFARLRCDEYLKIKAGTDKLFGSVDKPVIEEI